MYNYDISIRKYQKNKNRLRNTQKVSRSALAGYIPQPLCFPKAVARNHVRIA